MENLAINGKTLGLQVALGILVGIGPAASGGSDNNPNAISTDYFFFMGALQNFCGAFQLFWHQD